MTIDMTPTTGEVLQAVGIAVIAGCSMFVFLWIARMTFLKYICSLPHPQYCKHVYQSYACKYTGDRVAVYVHKQKCDKCGFEYDTKVSVDTEEPETPKA